MTRGETISAITQRLQSFDDAQLQTLSGIVEEIAAQGSEHDTFELRELTVEELALIEQSKRDFAEGRVLTSDEARASTAAFLDALGATHKAR
jgi:hypothetical protein